MLLASDTGHFSMIKYVVRQELAAGALIGIEGRSILLI